MENINSVKDMIANSLEQVRTLLDANTIVGEQIRTDSGTVIIPISKLSMGIASGGLDLPGADKDASKNFGGGGGTGISVLPVCFLVVKADGCVEMLPVSGDKTPIEEIAGVLERIPSIFQKVKDILDGSDSEAESEEEEADAAAEAAAEVVSDACAESAAAENAAPISIEKAAGEEAPVLSEREKKKLVRKAAKEEKRAKRLAALEALDEDDEEDDGEDEDLD